MGKIENKKLRTWFIRFFEDYNIVFMLIILVIVSSLLSKNFLNFHNLINLCNQMAAPIAVAMGMLFVILIGGIDLSVGSIAAVGSVLVATFCKSMPLGSALVCTLIIGTLIGTTTGLLVAWAKIVPFIATLAMQTICTGIAFIVSRGSPIPTPGNVLNKLGQISVGYIPGLVIVALFIVVVAWAIQYYTPYGRIVMAIGSNESVVHLAGIRVPLYKISVFAISGFCATVAGIIISARTTIGSPQIGTGMELDAIAAAVIGGASLNGGKGTAVRTLAGVICLGMIGNVMNLVGVPSYPQSIVKGVIIIFAVILQGFTNNNIS